MKLNICVTCTQHDAQYLGVSLIAGDRKDLFFSSDPRHDFWTAYMVAKGRHGVNCTISIDPSVHQWIDTSDNLSFDALPKKQYRKAKESAILALKQSGEIEQVDRQLLAFFKGEEKRLARELCIARETIEEIQDRIYARNYVAQLNSSL